MFSQCPILTEFGTKLADIIIVDLVTFETSCTHWNLHIQLEEIERALPLIEGIRERQPEMNLFYNKFKMLSKILEIQL